MTYLNLEEVLTIHHTVVQIGGGSAGIRDLSALLSALELPKAGLQGKQLYPTIPEKAAALFRSLILNHPFIDGNKRTAYFCMLRFLYKNQVELKPSDSQVISFVAGVVQNVLDFEQIVTWIKQHS